MTINIHEIAAALHARKTGTGWIAKCPAHQDKSPSLSLRERDGRVLVHCHAGCPQADVIAALRQRCLWPERSREQWLRPPPDPDRARDQIRAAYWKISVTVFAEWLPEAVSLTDPVRMPLTGLVRILYLGDEALLKEYRAWKRREPELTAGLVHAGRLSDVRLQRRLARWIAEGMHGEYVP